MPASARLACARPACTRLAWLARALRRPAALIHALRDGKPSAQLDLQAVVRSAEQSTPILDRQLNTRLAVAVGPTDEAQGPAVQLHGRGPMSSRTHAVAHLHRHA